MDASNNDYTLQSGSPAVDTGDNTNIPSGVIADLLNNQRIHNGTVDMGAFEFGASSLAIDEFELSEDGVVLYPNPTTSLLNIDSYDVIEHIVIYDITGKRILQTNSTVIDVSNFNRGIYILKARTNNDEIIKRFIKQ